MIYKAKRPFKMGKRLNVEQLSKKKYSLVEGLSQELQDAIGQIEDSFTAIIYGGSGNGKTNFLVRLLKELKGIGDMLYISYEEAHGKTIQDLIFRHNLHVELPNLRFSDGETFEELTTMLKKKRSPKIVVIDSWQFSNLTYANFDFLFKNFVFGKTANKRKIFLVISHIGTGKEPDGKSAMDIKKMSNIKILVEGFVAIVKVSRYGSKKNMVIWEDGAKEYWGKDFKKLTGLKYQKAQKKQKELFEEPPPEPITNMQLLPEETQADKDQQLLNNLKKAV